MVHLWTVVIDDGTRPYGPGIAPDQRRPLAITAGEDTRIEISLINPVGGALAPLGGGGFLQFTARQTGRGGRQILTARSAPISGNRHAVTIAAAMTKGMLPTSGTFDMWLARGSLRDQAIPTSEFALRPSGLGNNDA